MNKKSDNLFFLYLGTVLVIFGTLIFFEGGYYSSRFGAVSFGGHHDIVGFVFITLGGMCFWSVFRK
ncbi:hypothetical protein SADO_12238 [Salinisphaera dokdonensis CL-ES53]|uniref:Uncharacterized protein n=1 Tax=Salinisphaera dokdonensis CL-ES53 TaxID=1304272 RepID=A0ABV2B2B2_9GAMM